MATQRYRCATCKQTLETQYLPPEGQPHYFNHQKCYGEFIPVKSISRVKDRPTVPEPPPKPKKINPFQRAILEDLASHGPKTVSQIAKDLGYKKPDSTIRAIFHMSASSYRLVENLD